MNPDRTIQKTFISQNGSELVLKLYNAMRSLAAVQHDIITLWKMVEAVMEKEGGLSFHINEDRLFLNNNRIEMRSGHLVHHTLLSELRKRRIGRIEFSEVPDPQDLETFLRHLMETVDHGLHDSTRLQQILAEEAIASIVVEELGQGGDVENRRLSHGKTAHHTQVYFYAISLMRALFLQTRRNRPLDPSIPSRVVRTITTCYGRASATFMRLATFKTSQDFLANHAVNVAIYAIALGHRLGFSNRFLVDLGLAALLHDIGESRLGWLEDTGERRLTQKEWGEVVAHPAEGVRIMTGMRGVDLATMSRLIAGAFEHHIRYDLSGFPGQKRKRKLSLVGGIIALADFYDLAARPSGERMFPFFSDQLLEAIIERSGRDFDPILARYFLRSVGILPVGTLCRLDTGELGIVNRPTEEDTTGERPWVRLLTPRNRTYQPGEEVNLNSMDRKTGKYGRSIVEILDPNEMGIDVAEYLIELESGKTRP
jgi:HD-GYP domain-containing protein (c-di-GMP phosphodiesterase class II)